MSTSTNSDAKPEAKPAAMDADLAEAHARALALDGEGAAGGAVEETADEAGRDYAGDAASLVDIAAESLSAFYPSTEAVLTPEKRAKIAAPLGKVMEKYGLDLASILGQWGPEISLAFAVSQVAIPIAKAIRADRDAADAAAATAAVGKLEVAPGPAEGNPIIAASSASPAASLHARA